MQALAREEPKIVFRLMSLIQGRRVFAAIGGRLKTELLKTKMRERLSKEQAVPLLLAERAGGSGGHQSPQRKAEAPARDAAVQGTCEGTHQAAEATAGLQKASSTSRRVREPRKKQRQINPRLNPPPTPQPPFPSPSPHSAR